MALTFSQAKQIPITEYLSGYGYESVRISGHDHWYLSPIRNEKNPSFKVNTKLNLWYDHGIGEGGTLIDLGVRMHNCSPAEFLVKIGHELPFRKEAIKVDDSRESKLTVLSVGRLIDENLLEYVTRRGVLTSDAKTFCSEVIFKIGNKQYKAVGFVNQSGGYELRNSWFKGSSSPKDISVIERDSTRVCLFEGFIDFLSLSRLSQEGFVPPISEHNIIVLNSMSLLKKSLPLLERYSDRTIFFDNDGAGKMGKVLMGERGIGFTDGAVLYQGYKDVNDFLCGVQGREPGLTRSFGVKR